MTLKNSFWASLKENNKRRIWLWILSSLAYVIGFPTVIAMLLSGAGQRESYLIETLGETLGREALHKQLVSLLTEDLGVGNYVLAAAAAAVAVVSAVQGFSYLYNKRKIDFYMGMPVKRSRRFLVIWLNGILVYLIPGLLGTLLTWLIAAGYGALEAQVIRESALAFGMLLGLYLGVYHLTLLAVMLTGNVIITLLGTAVFLLYELVVRVLFSCLMQMFFWHYNGVSGSTTPLLSPFSIYSRLVERQEAGTGGIPAAAFGFLLFAAALGALAYACYLKRPAEAAGKAMAFALPQPVIKILLVVPVTLAAGLFVSEVTNYDPLWGEGSAGLMIFAMAVVLVVASCLIQVLYEFDIKGIFHKKLHILISTLITVVVFMIFRYDAFGYDTYLPDVEAVSSGVLVAPYEYSIFSTGYVDENMTYISKEDFAMENMYLTDIGALNKLVKKSMEAQEEYENLDQLYEKEDAQWYTVNVIWRMNGKRTVSRRIYVDLNDEETMEILDRLVSSDEYCSAAYISVAESVSKMLSSGKVEVSAVYGSTVSQQMLEKEEIEELLALYKEDVKGTSLSSLRESIPTGSIQISIIKRNDDYTSYREQEIKIYPFFTGCVEYLKEKGYYREKFLEPDEVEKIQVVNYNYKALNQTKAEGEAVSYPVAQAVDTNTSDYTRYAVYTEKEDIEALCETLYPSAWIYSGWSMAAETESGYQVMVYLKSGSSGNGSGTGVEYFCFLEGEVPEFVQQDTVYAGEQAEQSYKLIHVG